MNSRSDTATQLSPEERLRLPDRLQSGAEAGKSLVRLHTADAEPPLFCIHGLGGHVAAFWPLARHSAVGRTVYAFQGQGLEANQQPHDCIETMASFYLEEMRGVQQRGPYLLAGWSMGGLIAMELARQLDDIGQRVAMLILFDTHLSSEDRAVGALDDASVMRWIAPHVDVPPEELRALPPERQWEVIAEGARLSDENGAVDVYRLAEACKAHLVALSRHELKPYGGETVLFQAAKPACDLDEQWATLCPRFHAEQTPGDHYSMFRQSNVEVLAERVGDYLSGSTNYY